MVKRLVSLVTIVLGLGSIQAMDSTISKDALDLFKKALIGQVTSEAFEQEFDKAPYDVDLVESEPGVTLAHLIVAGLSSADYKKNALGIAKVVQQARREQDIVVQGLYKAYEDNPTSEALDNLKSWRTIFIENIDIIGYDPNNPGMTIGERITDLLATPTHRKTAVEVAKVFHEDRSNKNVVLQTLFRAWEHDYTIFEDLEAWFRFIGDPATIKLDRDKLYSNVDKIDYDELDSLNPTKRLRTIGHRITELLTVGKNRGEVLKVAKLVHYTCTDEDVVFQVLFKAWEHDKNALDALKCWLKDFVEDVDDINYDEPDQTDPQKKIRTIGERIAELFTNTEHRKAALELAKLLQVDRSDKDMVFQTLFSAWENDATVVEDLQSWIKDFEEDVDDIDCCITGSGKRIGERISELLSSRTYRKGALAVAKMVQAGRRDKHMVLRALFAACENDRTDKEAFNLLKEWQEFVKADIAVIIVDPTNSETIRDRIANLSRNDLSAVFDHSATKASNSTNTGSAATKKGSSLSPAKIVGAAVLVVGGLLYYYRIKNDANKQRTDRDYAVQARV
jgi:hypothetical protein